MDSHGGERNEGYSVTARLVNNVPAMIAQHAAAELRRHAHGVDGDIS